jgi:hypothetical protein
MTPPARTSFTRHAWQRVLERLSLTMDDVAQILDMGLAVEMGTSPGTNRCQRLFYSPPEDDFFIAIQDKTCGVVITVLPLAFHENLAWHAPNVALTKARRLVCGNEEPVPPRPRSGFRRITAYVYSVDRIDVLHLGSWAIESCDGCVDRLLNHDQFVSAVEAQLEAKGIARDHVGAIYARLGNTGEPTRICLESRTAQSAVAA